MENVSKAERMLFLPGATGAALFWQPVIDRLILLADPVAIDYPGFGDNLPDPQLASLEDLTGRIEAHIDRPVDIVAQSMGGVIAMKLALRKRLLVRHIVLTAPSGGVPMDDFNATEWRDDYRAESPNNPPWFTDDHADLSMELSNLSTPCLLIFGTRDAVAPLTLGEYLLRLLPNARLATVDTSNHSFAQDMPDQVAPLIEAFLTT